MTTNQAVKPFSKTSTRRIAIIIVLVTLLGGGALLYLRFVPQNTTSTTTTATLQTAKATTGDLVLFADGTGKIQPAGESRLSFNASGQVSNINIAIGDHVEAGQVLAQLDDTSAKIKLATAQEAFSKLTSAAALAAAEQTLADAQASFVSAKATLEHLISPEVLYWEERVAEREQILADAKAASQTDTSDTAKQKLTDAEASLKFAQDSLTYFQQVYEQEYIPATFTQYRTMQSPRGTRTEVIRIEDATTGELINLVYPPTAGEIGTARADYDLVKASVYEAQTYLDVLNGAEIPDGATGANLVTYLQTKHALETAEYNVNATKLTTPINGTVTALDIHVGDLATSGSSVMTISNLDQPYSLDAYLDAKDWGQVQIGDEVDVTFDIIPDKVFKGVVTGIYPTLDTASASSALVHFTARLNHDTSYELPSGSTASVDVIGGRAQNAVLVPIEALHKISEGKYALFVMENGKLRLRMVEVGLQDLTKAQIISGLKAGDIVSTGIVKTK